MGADGSVLPYPTMKLNHEAKLAQKAEDFIEQFRGKFETQVFYWWQARHLHLSAALFSLC